MRFALLLFALPVLAQDNPLPSAKPVPQVQVLPLPHSMSRFELGRAEADHQPL